MEVRIEYSRARGTFGLVGWRKAPRIEPMTTTTSTKMPAARRGVASTPSKATRAVKSTKAAARVAPKSDGSAKNAKGMARAGADFDATMRALERAGTAQARKIYLRHGAQEPMFGVSFATLKAMVKKIGVDHALARKLWDSGNHDARILAIKVADPAAVSGAELDRWAGKMSSRSCGAYVSMLAAESGHGVEKATAWLASDDSAMRSAGWSLVIHLANLDESLPDAWFTERLARIERTIHSAPNSEREAMNMAVISIGGRNPALRKLASASAKRIGKVEVDHGDTDCKTPAALDYIEKTWAHAQAKKFSSPAAQERSRERMRTRC